MTPTICIDELTKVYRLGAECAGGYRTLRETIMGSMAAPWRCRRGRSADPSGETVRALDAVSFDVHAGEVVGIIGRNGAGKSTLLKVLSRITEPTLGRAEVRGRVGSLLEVGTGFHPELTGRENIFLNGAILGMSRREIVRKFDDIVAFAETARFIDTPVKHYSSGMYVRLAFAVAAHLEAEVLLVDEVLAVGDAAFQRRCLEKMSDISRSGRTVLFISHNLGAIRSLCHRAVTLEQGRVLGIGPAEEQVRGYLARLAGYSRQTLDARTDREGDGRARLTYVRIIDEAGDAVDQVFTGAPVAIALGYRAEAVGASPEVALSIWSAEGQKVFHVDNQIRGRSLPRLRGAGEYACSFPKLVLAPGTYHVNAMLKVDGVISDHIYSAAVFHVLPGDFYSTGKTVSACGGVVIVDHDWRERPSLS